MSSIAVPVSLAQLVGTLHNLCRGRGSNPGHPTSPHLIVWALATKLLDQKKKSSIAISFLQTINNDEETLSLSCCGFLDSSNRVLSTIVFGFWATSSRMHKNDRKKSCVWLDVSNYNVQKDVAYNVPPLLS